MSLTLPNIRELFIPDPGYVILDCDLAGADAQVVAWEANDADLKEAFRAGLKIHHKNAEDMWPSYAKLPVGSAEQKKRYYEAKRAVHATNYLSSARNIAAVLNWSVREAEDFKMKWFNLHPGIKEWHNATRRSLENSRSVRNQFGFVRTFFERIDSALTNAVAWVPQSTVAIVCFRGALRTRELPWVQLLLQVHDSLVMQIPRDRVPSLPLIRDALTNPVPYDDPLVIPWGVSISSRSWGHCIECSWEEAAAFRSDAELAAQIAAR